MRDATGFLREEYEDIVEKGFDWKLRRLEGPSTPVCTVDGKEVIMLCSNNYLSLSNHPKLREAAKKAIDSHGAGSGSVRAIAGNMDLHEEAEDRVARFKGTEASLIYQTGFAANAGLIPQLCGKGDIFISDELNHGSIIDGVRLSKADRAVYAHNDMAECEKVVKEVSEKDYRRILILTDGVFSMDGDVAHMDRIVEIAKQYGAMTYVDDAHGEGVIGPDGRGIGAHFGITGEIDVEMGTFSKAFGVVGGLVAGSEDLKKFAYNKSRTWLLSGSHPPAVAAAQIAAIDVLETEPEHVRRLWENTNYFKKEIQGMGYDTGDSTTPITPVICGESHKAKELSTRLYDEGIFGLPIVFPMVARDKARIRTMMNAGLTREHLDKALGAFESIGKDLKII
ncbi:MAG: 8-amino-7-oxononanoate synthase [Candidatus Proteinoplasmatales archaeon SG8-5]|nr:MAG: 8-amino-7-oxononanoate synthase [Candidatus Proteinoplasmatales archaeon SG8-5]